MAQRHSEPFVIGPPVITLARPSWGVTWSLLFPLRAEPINPHLMQIRLEITPLQLMADLIRENCGHIVTRLVMMLLTCC